MENKVTDSAREYAKAKTRVYLADIVFTAVCVVLFQFMFSRQVTEGVSFLRNFYLACAAYMTVFFVFMYAAGLPLRYYSSFVLEHEFGLSRQSFAAWLKDEAKSSGLSFFFSMLSVMVFYFVLLTAGAIWWVVVSCVFVFFSVIIARIFPLLIIPLFFKYLPIADETLKKKITELGSSCGINVIDVCLIDLSRKTNKANAALVGLGSTRKVILSDTLLAEFDHDEVLAVVAHELGHLKYRHMLKFLSLSALSTLGGFFILSKLMAVIVTVLGARGTADLAIFPSFLLLLMFFGLLLLPLQNLFSRILERQADRYSLDKVAGSGVFISVMQKLARINLSETDPPLWKKVLLYDHPPISERIEMARRTVRECDERT